MIRVVEGGGGDDNNRRSSNEENNIDNLSFSQSEALNQRRNNNEEVNNGEVDESTSPRPGLLLEETSSCDCCLLSLGDDIFQLIGSYCDPVDLSMLDGCCRTTQQVLCRPVWQQKLIQSNFTATSHAWVDLQQQATATTTTTSSSSSKSLTILNYRVKQFAMKIENQRSRFGLLCGYSSRDDDDQEENEENDVLNQERSSHESLPIVVEVHTFQEPDAYYYFVRLSIVSSCSNNNQAPKNNSNNNNNNIVLWEGFSTPMEQGAWGESTILFFHLKEISNNINWTQPIKDAFNYYCRQQQEQQTNDLGNDDDDSNNSGTQQHQTRIKNAFKNMALTIVALRRYYHFHDQEKPSLVLFSIGLDSVSRDNRTYYRFKGQRCRRSSRSQQEHETNNNINTNQTEEEENYSTAGKEESCWVYPTLVTNRIVAGQTTEKESTELLGIRVVCNGIG